MIECGYRFKIPLGSGICQSKKIISRSIFRFMCKGMFECIDCIVKTFLTKESDTFQIDNFRIIRFDLQCTVIEICRF